MKPESEWIRLELPDVAQIYQIECRLESKRRGRPVGPHDSVVRTRVANHLLNGGGERIRRRLMQRMGLPDLRDNL